MTALEAAVGVEREAPRDVLRGLRVIDPTAELIYLGTGRWLLGRVVSSAPIRAAGERLAASCTRATKTRNTASRTLTPEDYDRHLMAQLRLRGFQPTTEYRVCGEPTGAIVRDQEVMDFLYRTLSDDAVDALADEDHIARKAQARADLTDEARARDAWRWMFTRSHSVTRFGAGPQRARSGFTLHQKTA